MARSMDAAPIKKSMVDVERELVGALGFFQKLFQAQSALPLVTSAEARLFGAALLAEGRLTRSQKEGLILVVAGARGEEWWQRPQVQSFPSDDNKSRALSNFALKL